MSDKDLYDYLYWCADRYLSYRPRTEYELRRYLTQKLKKRDIADSDEQTIYVDAIIQKLYAEHRIDDEKFVPMFVDDKQYFRPHGVRRLKMELKKKGISPTLIDNYFLSHTINEVPLIISIIQKKFFLNNIDHTSLDPKTHKKITDHLLRKGFSYSNIKLAFEEIVKKK